MGEGNELKDEVKLKLKDVQVVIEVGHDLVNGFGIAPIRLEVSSSKSTVTFGMG
jgi:hypothetical protein